MFSLLFQRLWLFAAGLALLSAAAVLPIYLRAVDSWAVESAGVKTVSLAEEAKNQLGLEKPGVADLLLKGAQQCTEKSSIGADGWEDALSALDEFRRFYPDLTFLGGDFPEWENVPLGKLARQEGTALSVLINKRVRAAVLQRLQNSRRPGVQDVLQNRGLTHTEVFPPVSSPGGGAFEAIIVVAALLSQGDYLNAEFRFELERLAGDANRGRSKGIESAYLDLLSFARRMNWAQFSGFMARIESRQTLGRLARAIVDKEEELPVLFAAVWMGTPAEAVGRYLQRYPESGLQDLALGLSARQGGLESILNRQERVHRPALVRQKMRDFLPPALQDFAVNMASQLPWLSLLAKYTAILLGSFCWIRLAFLLVPGKFLPPTIFRVEGIATLRQQILALLFLVLAVLLGEPFLAQDRQKEETSLRWKFPTAPAAVVEKADAMLGSKVGDAEMVALAFFLLVQAVLYGLSLAKLKEIQKQAGSSRLKLRLLDNEENMFDSGLYVGLGGTVLSLVLLTIQMVQIGLMAAYASTLFGIIFVSLLKIFHVRPYRRKLLIETEAGIL